MGPACAVEKCKQAITRELRHTPPSQSPSRSVTLTDIRCPMRTYVFACLTDAFSGVLAHSVEAILRMVSRKSPRSGYVTTYPLSARRSGSVMRTIQVCVFSVQVVKCRPTKIFLNRTFLNSSVLPPPYSSSSAFALNNLPSPSPGSPREPPGGISGYAFPPRVPAHAAPPQGHLCNAAQRQRSHRHNIM